MNTGLKIGLGVLAAVLLVITAVSLTLAVTRSGSVQPLASAGFQNGNGASVQYAAAPYYGCPAWARYNAQTTTGPGYSYRGCWGW